MLGAEPYFAGNVGSGTPEELRDWVEYCNYPSGSTLSDERAANGSPEPFAIKYWGVGNENWGCGGNMRPEEYAGLYRRYSTYVRTFGETQPFLIACGPNGNNTEWSRRFLETMDTRRLPNGFSMHFYSNGKNPATQYTVENMQEQFASFGRLEQAIQQQRALLDSFDPERKVGLNVDEWGVWDRILAEDEKAHGKLWQPITMRSAVAAALGLNVFHRQADKLHMCNIAQMVNVLHSLLLTEGEKCVRTTTYHVFDMMKGHRNKTAVRVETPPEESQGLSVSASRTDRELVLTLVNSKHDSAVTVDCALTRATARSASAQLLHDSDFNAANTFDSPDRITPREHRIQTDAARLTMELPPLSVVAANVALA